MNKDTEAPPLVDKKCADRIEELLSEALSKMEVKNNRFLTDSARLFLIPSNESLPKTGKVRQRLETYIGHLPIVEYISDQISKDLDERFEYDSNKPTSSLTDLDGYESPKETALRLVSEFQKIPERYKIILQIPSRVSEYFSLITDGYKFSDDFEIRFADQGFCDEFPINSNNPARQKRIHPTLSLIAKLDENNNQKWDEGKNYIIIETNGYIDQYGFTQPALQAKNLTKSFFGLALALSAFSLEYQPLKIADQLKYFVFRRDQDTWAIDGKFSADEHTSKIIGDFVPLKLKKEHDNKKIRLAILETAFKNIGLVLSNRGRSDRILIAAQWYFDAFGRQDEMLSFVQLVIVMEVLLGEKADSDEIGLGTLLKNRAAYLIANSTSEREELSTRIGEIYKLRSKIVHTGKHFLTPAERVLYSQLKKILNRIFRREIDLLKEKKP